MTIEQLYYLIVALLAAMLVALVVLILTLRRPRTVVEVGPTFLDVLSRIETTVAQHVNGMAILELVRQFSDNREEVLAGLAAYADNVVAAVLVFRVDSLRVILQAKHRSLEVNYGLQYGDTLRRDIVAAQRELDETCALMRELGLGTVRSVG